jgi:hypothetical protein
MIPPLTSPEIREAAERTAADALNASDIRAEMRRRWPDLFVPDDVGEVDLVVSWFWHANGHRWPELSGSDSLGPFVNGGVIDALLGQDLAAGRDPAERALTDYQVEWLQKWRRQVAEDERRAERPGG